MTKRIMILAGSGLLAIAGVRGLTAQEPGVGEGVAAYLVMIANQGTQIANQVATITQLQEQLAQQVQQYAHLQDSALGMIGAIADPIQDLIALPTDLLSTRRVWADDFTGPARDVLAAVEEMGSGTSFSAVWRGPLDAARTVTEESVRGSYAGQPAEVAAAAAAAWRDRQNAADKRLVLSHVRADAAANLAATAESAQEKIDALAARDPLSDTALQQALLAGNLSQGQVLTALAQMEAWDSSEAAALEYDAEIARRERDAMHVAERLANAAALEAQLQAIEAQRDARERGLRFRLHPLYGGTH